MRIASRICVPVVVVSLVGSLGGCTDDPAASEEYATLERELDQIQAELAAIGAERDELQAAVETEGEWAEPFDLDAYAAAWGSGDADQIRAFYTDDAVMMPFGHILSTLSAHPTSEYWDVSGADMDREAHEHEGAVFEFVGVQQIGNMVVTTGRWTFPQDLYPDLADAVIETADIWHLRDGKIWRHFADFEVYVDDELIEM